jgi:putative transposase
MQTNQPGHLKTFDYLGLHRYFLTFCTNYRRHAFQNGDVVNLVLAQISRTAREGAFELLAYCFMPDHLHPLVEGTAENSDCRRFIKSAKQYSGYYFEKDFKQKLWQRYGFERWWRIRATARLRDRTNAVDEILEAVGECDFRNSWST